MAMSSENEQTLPVLRVLFCVSPAKASNERDTLRAVPGVQMRVLSSDDGLHPDTDIGLAASRVPVLGHPERWTAALAWLRGMGSVEPGPVDLVVSQELYNPTSIQAGDLARRVGVPHVVLIAEILRDNPLYTAPPWRQIARRVASRADAFVCITETARRHVIARGAPADRCHVVHLGVDTERFRPAPELVSDAVVLFVGELRPDKGIRDLVQACELVSATVPDLRLRVVGDGPLYEELTRLEPTTPFLEMLGRRPRDEVPGLLRRARVLSVPSRSRRLWAEQFGFALVEAMATALPVVTTRCGAIPEVVPNWNPIVAEGDVAAIARGLEAALGADGDDWGPRNREYTEAHYEVRGQGDAFGRALRSIVERGPASAR
jgi:glycosyltransferase involved in cell wall biosynthesis